jgi:SAM-dependent methyltransferase
MKLARELLQQGRLDELEDLISRSEPAEAAHLRAALYLAKKEPAQALESIRQAVALQADFSTRNTLAVCLLACGKNDEAAHILSGLTEEQPDNADLWFNLARCRRDSAAARRAFELRPDWLEARLLLVSRLAGESRFQEALGLVDRENGCLAARLWEVRLLLWSGRAKQAISSAMLLLEESEQAPLLLLEAVQEASEVPGDTRILKALRDHLDTQVALALIPPALRLWPDAEDLLLHLLREGQVCDYELECKLTRWRREFRADPRPSPLADALAAHNYTYEFAFLEEPGEVPEPDHPAYPLYRPLVGPTSTTGPLTLQRHLEEPAQEREILAGLRTLDTEDVVARQYTENPYPRWRTLGFAGSPRPFGEVISTLFPGETAGSPSDILVAGCGTGRHAMTTARRFASSRVWGIDVSRASLSYALRQRRRLGVDNVEFLPADLLNLSAAPPQLPRSFGAIESVGVLHHLEEPLSGLLALRERLENSGWIRLGFYSRRARRRLQAGRTLARRHPELELRDLRALLLRELAPEDLKVLTGLTDFYSLSGLRDLLAHPRETESDLPQISRWLEEARLRFVGFDPLRPTVRSKFIARYGKGALSNLESWDDFEKAHPETFLGMYVFWCQALP